jgi:hypothetical protein
MEKCVFVFVTHVYILYLAQKHLFKDVFTFNFKVCRRCYQLFLFLSIRSLRWIKVRIWLHRRTRRFRADCYIFVLFELIYLIDIELFLITAFFVYIIQLRMHFVYELSEDVWYIVASGLPLKRWYIYRLSSFDCIVCLSVYILQIHH